MVRTGARARTLHTWLTRAGLRSDTSGSQAPRIAALSADARAAVVEVYRQLGGQQTPPAIRQGPWDLAFVDGLVVELDEELHFNRYRARTLQAMARADLPWHAAYAAYCDRHERRGLMAGKWGKRWTSRPSESMFGPPGAAGDLTGAGAPRWRQRAFYDAVKDFIAIEHPTLRLARLSVWDVIGDVTLGHALGSDTPIDVDELRALLDQRTTSSP